jgi:PQQ-dependent dehydrogenase (s-GDH family)
MVQRGQPWAVLLLIVAATAAVSSRQNPRGTTAPASETFTSRAVAANLGNPWEVTWGPDGHLWITERTAFRVTRVNPADGSRRVALTLDDVYQTSVQDGLMGMALHPDLLKSRGRDWVFLVSTYDADAGSGVTRRLRVRRYTYDPAAQTLGSPVTVIDNLPAHDDHGGGRILVGPDGRRTVARRPGRQLARQLLQRDPLAGSDRGQIAARDWVTYQGKVLRLELDGAIPADNPTINGVRSHVFSYGLRNPQGLTFGPSGLLYASEHGPSTDDEIDLIQAGKNYGWPHVAGYNDDRSYAYANWSASSTPCASLEFNSLTPPPSVPQTRESAWQHPDFVPPLITLFTAPAGYDLGALGATTIGPGSIDFYDSPAIPGWRQSLIVTGMRTGALYRVALAADGRSVAGPALLYFKQDDRYRDIAISPGGRRLFVVTDNEGRTRCTVAAHRRAGASRRLARVHVPTPQVKP